MRLKNIKGYNGRYLISDNGKEIAQKFNIDLSMVVKISKNKAYNWINER